MELGIQSHYESSYNPGKLFAIARQPKRLELEPAHGRKWEPGAALPFIGHDVWNHYEVSWLGPRGKPEVATAQIVYSCTSENLIESKSLKLYFNSLNNTRFDTLGAVADTVTRDLSALVKAPVAVHITPLRLCRNAVIALPEGICLDELDVAIEQYCVEPGYLRTGSEQVEETLYSDLLKSNCLVTGQPDWGTVTLQYRGKKIDRAGLLQYLVSFRNHDEFHEQCVERIFVDIMRMCAPQTLIVRARYTRRGGIDINPVRATSLPPVFNQRLIRQ